MSLKCCNIEQVFVVLIGTDERRGKRSTGGSPPDSQEALLRGAATRTFNVTPRGMDDRSRAGTGEEVRRLSGNGDVNMSRAATWILN
jgi:hypothetical protein